MVIETTNAVASGSGMQHNHENNHFINDGSNQIRNGTFSSEPRYAHTDPNNGPNSQFRQLALGEDGDDGSGNGNGDGNDNGNGNTPPPNPTPEMHANTNLHINILVDLTQSNLDQPSAEPQTTRDEIWDVLEQSHAEIVRRLRLRNFDGIIVDEGNVTEGVMRFDGYIPVMAVVLVAEEDEAELLHRSLEQWLITMMDVVEQGFEISVPWSAGAWEMRWYRD